MDTRLKHIARLALSQGAYTVVDCGCDHGKVLFSLLKDNPECRAVAIDKSAPSLDKARRLLEPFGERVTFLCADGIACLSENRYNVLIISGVGGHNMIDILTRGKASFDRLVLSPHRDANLVKQWLEDRGSKISQTSVVCRNKVYTVFAAD